MKTKRQLQGLLNRKETRGWNAAIGGLGTPSKMPGYSYGISASRCRLGRELAKQPGTICASCYATRGHYTCPSVAAAHEKRWEAMRDIVTWRESMVCLLQALGSMLPREQRYFRFHDSGDLQGLDHLVAISWVASQNPEWQFWLPTREYGMVRSYLQRWDIPMNLTIRLSALRIDASPPDTQGLPSSTVGYDAGFQCPARQQGNACGTCRACWDVRVLSVNYKKH